MASKDYFASREGEELVSALDAKTEHWSETLESNGYFNKLRDMYAAYHGAYYNSVGEAHQISFGGDEGELVEISVNDLRSLARHMLSMMTSSRPAMETRAINTDYKSVVQTQLANGLLDYYMREKKLEEYFKDACEYAIVFGSGYVKLAWNQMLGMIVNQKEIDAAETLGNEIPAKEYEGDLEVITVSPLDIIQDLTKEGRDLDWVIVRSFKNRFDLIAKYPDLEEEIMAIDSKDALNRVSFKSSDDETDDIPVFEFYHRRSEALPNGKYAFYASPEARFYEGDLPYKNIPVYEVSAGKILGTPLGYSDLFDVLPLQDASNSLYSAAMTNLNAFSVSNILNPVGSNLEVTQLSGALNIIDFNPQAGEPRALDLVKISPQLFQMIDVLNNKSETISGINSVVRGNPEASLRSGSAIAMIQSNAIEFMSGLQASYTYLIENTGLGMLEIIKDFANSPRIANIVGASGRSYMKEFTGDDISDINRVIVDSANAMTKTISGRIQMADNLLQYGVLTPEQYMNIINTGNLESGTEDTQRKVNNLKAENEGMLFGVQQRAIFTDNHLEHINSHKSVLDDPSMRSDEKLASVVLAHIQEHMDLLKNTDPQILMALGQQPIQPPQPAAPEGMPAAPVQGGEVEPMPAAQQPSQDQAMEANNTQLNAVRLPEGFEDAPLTMEQNAEQKGLA